MTKTLDCDLDFSGITKSILNAVEHEFAMSGLSSGIYGQYASVVAGRILFSVMHSINNSLPSDHKLPLSDDEIYKISSSIQEALDD